MGRSIEGYIDSRLRQATDNPAIHLATTNENPERYKPRPVLLSTKLTLFASRNASVLDKYDLDMLFAAAVELRAHEPPIY